MSQLQALFFLQSLAHAPEYDNSAAMWSVFDAIPSLTLSIRVARPLCRLSVLAQALSRDGLKDHQGICLMAS